MTDALFAIVAMIAAFNPLAWAARVETAEADRQRSPLRRPVAAAVIGAVVLLIRAPLLDALQISGTSFEVAAGAVMGIAAVPVLLFGRAQALEAETAAVRSEVEALAWYALNPAALVGLVALPERTSLVATIVGLTVALLAAGFAVSIRARRNAPLPGASAGARVTAAVLVTVAVALFIAGVRSI